MRKYRFAAKMRLGNQAELSLEVWISLNGFGELLRALLHMGGLSDTMQREDAFSAILPSHILFQHGVRVGGQTASFVRWNAHRSGRDRVAEEPDRLGYHRYHTDGGSGRFKGRAV